MVASANKNKSYDLFLDVAKEISRWRNDVTFIGVGDGTELNRLLARISIEKIPNIQLIGHKNNIEDFVFSSDVGVLFTPSEGISNAIIEYMAMGLPVITTDIQGGSREIIEDSKSGFIMSNNVEKISEKINMLLNNENMRKQLGNKGRDIIEKKFTIERMGREYLKLYERI